MYILECADGSYYTGSTNNLELRLAQHQLGEGANHTKKHLPVKLVYFEEFQRIDEAFYREKQVQGWSRKKKEALINGEFDKLPELSKNYTQFPPQSVVSTSSTTGLSSTTDVPLPEPVEGSEKKSVETTDMKPTETTNKNPNP
ncbi:MAG: GIY-YIG nuclease family protein [Bacteroidetes bacterium]|nr:GIY-YIG nuclease family protein [Bacteroidota bacterium]